MMASGRKASTYEVGTFGLLHDRIEDQVAAYSQDPEKQFKERRTLVHISSEDRDTRLYPNPNHFVIELPRVFYNVKSVRCISSEFLNTELTIRSIPPEDSNQALVFADSDYGTLMSSAQSRLQVADQQPYDLTSNDFLNHMYWNQSDQSLKLFFVFEGSYIMASTSTPSAYPICRILKQTGLKMYYSTTQYVPSSWDSLGGQLAGQFSADCSVWNETHMRLRPIYKTYTCNSVTWTASRTGVTALLFMRTGGNELMWYIGPSAFLTAAMLLVVHAEDGTLRFSDGRVFVPASSDLAPSGVSVWEKASVVTSSPALCAHLPAGTVASDDMLSLGWQSSRWLSGNPVIPVANEFMTIRSFTFHSQLWTRVGARGFTTVQNGQTLVGTALPDGTVTMNGEIILYPNPTSNVESIQMFYDGSTYAMKMDSFLVYEDGVVQRINTVAVYEQANVQLLTYNLAPGIYDYNQVATAIRNIEIPVAPYTYASSLQADIAFDHTLITRRLQFRLQSPFSFALLGIAGNVDDISDMDCVFLTLDQDMPVLPGLMNQIVHLDLVSAGGVNVVVNNASMTLLSAQDLTGCFCARRVLPNVYMVQLNCRLKYPLLCSARFGGQVDVSMNALIDWSMDAPSILPDLSCSADTPVTTMSSLRPDSSEPILVREFIPEPPFTRAVCAAPHGLRTGSQVSFQDPTARQVVTTDIKIPLRTVTLFSSTATKMHCAGLVLDVKLDSAMPYAPAQLWLCSPTQMLTLIQDSTRRFVFASVSATAMLVIESIFPMTILPAIAISPLRELNVIGTCKPVSRTTRNTSFRYMGTDFSVLPLTQNPHGFRVTVNDDTSFLLPFTMMSMTLSSPLVARSLLPTRGTALSRDSHLLLCSPQLPAMTDLHNSNIFAKIRCSGDFLSPLIDAHVASLYVPSTYVTLDHILFEVRRPSLHLADLREQNYSITIAIVESIDTLRNSGLDTRRGHVADTSFRNFLVQA